MKLVVPVTLLALLLYAGAMRVLPARDLPTRLAVFNELAEAMEASGDAIAKITDGIKHLVMTGGSGYQFMAATRDRDRLIDISGRGTDITSPRNVRLINSIDFYLTLPDPTLDQWKNVKNIMSTVIVEVKKLLDDMKIGRSDFVLEKAYRKLQTSLNARVTLLDKLNDLPQPKTVEEKMALAVINREYIVLQKRLIEAIQQMNEYLVQHRKLNSSP